MRYELTREKFLNDKELGVLRKELSLNRDKDSRNVLLIELALATGGRAGELLALKFTDFSDDGVYITGSKDSKDRQIPLPPDIYARILMRESDSDPNDERVFPISYQRLVQIWNQYRPAAKGFHSLRHTAALLIYKRHKDLKLVQLMLGHRWASTTSIYSDFSYSNDEMKRLLIG